MRHSLSLSSKENSIDEESYSLHKFIGLATQGQSIALEMLFAPANKIECGPKYYIWQNLIEFRQKFISKDIHAFLGFAKKQASKYIVKGSRLTKLQNFCYVLSDIKNSDAKLSVVWDLLPKDNERINPQNIRELQIGTKWFGETTSVQNTLLSVSKTLNKYGLRSQNAGLNKVDWKSLSHAIRVCRQIIELLCFGHITFPLVDAELLLKIKQGNLSLDGVLDMIQGDMTFIELKLKESHLPLTTDKNFWDNWLLDTLKLELCKTL